MALAATAVVNTPIPYAPDAQQMVEELSDRVQEGQTSAYEAALARFDEVTQRFPDKLDLRVAKCRFIRNYTEADEIAIERSEEDLGECEDALRAAPDAADPRVQLFLLEGLYGKKGITAGEALLKEAANWPRPERARFYEQLSGSYLGLNEAAGQRYARLAVDADPASHLRLDVAEGWLKQGAFEIARKMVNATPWEAWKGFSVSRGADLLLRAGAPDDAAKLLAAHTPADGGWKLTLQLATALEKAGRVDEARRAYAKVIEHKEQYGREERARDYVRFVLAHGTAAEASTAYAKLREAGYTADPLARYRVELLLRHPLAPWHWLDILQVLVLLLALAATAMMPVVLVAPVHYRSLAKRVRGEQPQEGRWGLREVWIALAIVFVGQLLALYVFGYDMLLDLVHGSSRQDGFDPRSLANLMVAELAIILLCLMPLLRGVGVRNLLLGRSKVLHSIGWGLLAWFIVLLASGAYRVIFSAAQGASAGAIGDMTTLSIQSVQVVYGHLAALLAVCIATPLVEETVFRGVVLQGLSRYISFNWANLLQATLFMAIHESLAAMPIIFLIGWLAGRLVKRTGGLLAPMVLHALNNAVALGTITAATVQHIQLTTAG